MRLSSLCCLVVLAACGGPGLDRIFPDLVVEERVLEFGNLPVLNTRVKKTLGQNRGQAVLRLIDVQIVGDDAAMFEIADPPPARVEAGAEYEFQVEFRPEEERDYEAILRITSSDPDEGNIDVTLRGRGETYASIEVEPLSIHFGIVGEGTTALEQFLIRSVGTAPLIVEEVVFGASTPDGYLPVGAWTSGTLDVGEELPLSVAFQPALGQDLTAGTIEITSTDPFKRTVVVDLDAQINRAPLPACGDGEILAAPGDIVVFDGTASGDPDGHEPVSYVWEVETRPFNSNTPLVDPDSASPSLELDVPGDWTVTLCVTDALGVTSVDCCEVQVKSVPAEKLYVELVWDHPITDLDLHFVAPGSSVGGPGDCYWGNPRPDFGELGRSDDDPFLNKDDLAGFGPEIVTYKDPAPGLYQVLVDYAKDNGAMKPETNATLRIFQFGVLVREISRRLPQENTLWNVATIEWPSGEVVLVDKVTGS